MLFRAVAMHGAPPAYMEARLARACAPWSDYRHWPCRENEGCCPDRGCRGGSGLCRPRSPVRLSAVELGGIRTLLNVPMLKDKELIGAIAIYRVEVRPFTAKQIELVTHFASEACYCHREHAPAQRAAGSRSNSRPPPPMSLRPSAAQPSIHSAGGAGYAFANRRPENLRRGSCMAVFARRRHLPLGCELWPLQSKHEQYRAANAVTRGICPGGGLVIGRAVLESHRSKSLMCSPTRFPRRSRRSSLSLRDAIGRTVAA